MYKKTCITVNLIMFLQVRRRVQSTSYEEISSSHECRMVQPSRFYQVFV